MKKNDNLFSKDFNDIQINTNKKFEKKEEDKIQKMLKAGKQKYVEPVTESNTEPVSKTKPKAKPRAFMNFRTISTSKEVLALENYIQEYYDGNPVLFKPTWAQLYLNGLKEEYEKIQIKLNENKKLGVKDERN